MVPNLRLEILIYMHVVYCGPDRLSHLLSIVRALVLSLFYAIVEG